MKFSQLFIVNYQLLINFAVPKYMQDVAQLVRVLVCGAEGRGFEPHLPAQKPCRTDKAFFVLSSYMLYDLAISHNR